MQPFLTSVLMVALVGGAATCQGQGKVAPIREVGGDPTSADILAAFRAQGLSLNLAEASGIRANVLLALAEARTHGLGNSKVDFAAVEIAHDLNQPTGMGSDTVRRIVGALGHLLHQRPRPYSGPDLAWDAYFDTTVNLWNQPGFMNLMARHGFHPVKISWEDIGRHQGSVWGDRISDVGIWVRKDEQDPQSARLALSVRRDGNFRDKVLMVPAERIRIHQRIGGRTVEKTLPQRLEELGLTSRQRDRHVIVSNQFAIVPVPGSRMVGGAPPRAAFNFSIYPYGSTNFVITDVIEGSSDAIVGPGSHQMLYANIHGQKAPFTASRAEDRQDLLRLEQDLKARGMDVDVQRYYLIQIPLRRNVRGLQLSNLGTPPLGRGCADVVPECLPSMDMAYAGSGVAAQAPMPAAPPMMKAESQAKRSVAQEGLSRVAIGHGDAEGTYFLGAGFQGARAEEPIRVTVVYFVTPRGRVTEADMNAFQRAFHQWDTQAIWGGSFVTKE